MNNENLNNRIISVIKDITPPHKSVATLLMEVLNIGKESAYRRLRGEVPFSFQEVVDIASNLNLSIDSIIDSKNDQRAAFNFRLFDPASFMRDYFMKLSANVNLLRKMKKTAHSKVLSANNSLPSVFYLHHTNLSKFRLFAWIYQMSPESQLSFKNMEIPSEVLDMQKSYIAESRFIKEAYFILDRNIFYSIKYEIEFFRQLNILDDTDVKLIKSDLLEMLNELEMIAITGKHRTGTAVHLYLSSIVFDSTYTLYEYDGTDVSTFRVFILNSIESQSQAICKRQKQWIESLRRFSTLISQSNDIQRADYFNSQREVVNSIAE